MTKRTIVLLAAALLAGLLARLPGVWWGANFPPGWYGHHPDEYTHVLHAQLLINPHQPAFERDRSRKTGLNNPWAAGYSTTPYPKGMAMHIAAPVVAWRIITGGNRNLPPPASADIIPAGRLITVLYGTASILVTFLLARCLFTGMTVPLLAAWLLALGGLHVTQSHFYLADVPALFWMLLGTLLLWKDLADSDKQDWKLYAAAAFCLGVAFGLKLQVACIPSLGLAALMKGNRPARVVLAGVLFLTGMLAINLGTYTPLDFYRTLRSGVSDPYIYSTVSSALLYLAELPSILGLPLFTASLGGGVLLLARYARLKDKARRMRLGVVVLLPLLVQLLQVVSLSPGTALPSAEEPVRMSCWFGVSPRPLTDPPFSVSTVDFWIFALSECRSVTSRAINSPRKLYQGPRPIRSRAFTAGCPSRAIVLR